ncbi:hypothetical protein GCM10020001_033730 [Nonomuraea salmonea]
MMVLQPAERTEEGREDLLGVLVGGVGDAPGDEPRGVLQRVDVAVDDLVDPQRKLLLLRHQEDGQPAEPFGDGAQQVFGAGRVP